MKKKLNIFKKLFLIFFLSQVYSFSHAQENAPKLNNLSENYFFENIFDARIFNKKSIHYYFAKNQIKFSNIFAKIFDNTNQFFFSNFSNKYEITYFLNRNHYKKNQKLYIYSPDTLIRRPNLQNSVNNKFYLFEIIEDDLFVSKTKENYFKLNFDIYSNKKIYDLFSNSNIYIFDELYCFNIVKKLRDKETLLDDCKIKIKTFYNKKISFNRLNVTAFEKKNKDFLFYFYFLFTFFIIFFLKNFINIKKKINLLFYLKLSLLLIIIHNFLQGLFLTGEVIMEKFSFIIMYLIVLFKQYEKNFQKFKFSKIVIIALFIGLIIFLLLLDIQIYKTFLDIFSTIFILIIITYLIKKSYP